MALFATIERDSPQHVKLITLAHLAEDFKEKKRSEPYKDLSVVLYGYLTTVAASDAIKEEIERDLMNKSISPITKTLVQYGVPVDKIYIGEFVFSGPKARKIDIFLQQQGEAAPQFPPNPTVGRPGTPNFQKPVRDAELNIDSSKRLTLEVTVYENRSGRRTVVPEISFKSITAVTWLEATQGFSSQLTMWKPKLEGLLKRIGQQGLADKIEFAVKITLDGDAGKSKDVAKQISAEVAASLKAALTFRVPIPGTKREIPIELSYSVGGSYRANHEAPLNGRFAEEGKGMVTVTLFRFKSW
jgi:hypothetical protein